MIPHPPVRGINSEDRELPPALRREDDALARDRSEPVHERNEVIKIIRATDLAWVYIERNCLAGLGAALGAFRAHQPVVDGVELLGELEFF